MKHEPPKVISKYDRVHTVFWKCRVLIFPSIKWESSTENLFLRVLYELHDNSYETEWLNQDKMTLLELQFSLIMNSQA